jgi:REP element-mobilizing transposase RayT
MNKKFNGKYRIPSTRVKNYDYGQAGAYFVTICTKNQKHFFGEVAPIVETPNLGVSSDQGKLLSSQRYQMQYSKLGDIAQKYWLEIPNHFSFVTLGEWVVMPNHVHGVLIFDRKISSTKETPKLETPNLGVSTSGSWKPGNLGLIINQYKRACTIAARKMSSAFAWQSRFYEHIIRHEEELWRVSEYIALNPHNWEQDHYFNKFDKVL